jgi:hypothetical protein
MFDVLFYLLLVLLVSDRYGLDILLFEKIEDLEEQYFEQKLARNPGRCP